LHISDIHFKHEGAGIELASQAHIGNKLIQDARRWANENGSPDFIFVTGDIAWKGGGQDNDEYNGALEWLNRLIHDVRTNQDKVFLVPGNHDIDRGWVDNTDESRKHHKLFQRDIKELNVTLLYENNVEQYVWPKFKGFLQVANGEQFSGQPDIEPGAPSWSRMLPTRLGNVRLVGLNTCMASWGDCDATDNLGIGTPQIDSLFPRQDETRDLTIILQHHPLEWLVDGHILLSAFEESPFIICAGHIHKNTVTKQTNFNLNSGFQISAGAAHGDDKEHSYHWVRLSSEGVFFWPRSWRENADSFRPNVEFKLNQGECKLFPPDELPKSLRVWLAKSFIDNGMGDGPKTENEEHAQAVSDHKIRTIVGRRPEDLSLNKCVEDPDNGPPCGVSTGLLCLVAELNRNIESTEETRQLVENLISIYRPAKQLNPLLSAERYAAAVQVVERLRRSLKDLVEWNAKLGRRYRHPYEQESFDRLREFLKLRLKYRYHKWEDLFNSVTIMYKCVAWNTPNRIKEALPGDDDFADAVDLYLNTFKSTRGSLLTIVRERAVTNSERVPEIMQNVDVAELNSRIFECINKLPHNLPRELPPIWPRDLGEVHDG